MLRHRNELLTAGLSPRAIAEHERSGALRRVRRGWYLDSADAGALWPESQHLAHMLAVQADSLHDLPVFTHVSAAVAHGLPLWRVRPKRVHTALLGRGGHSIPDVMRHAAELSESDVVEVGGMRCTSLERTVHDLARTASAEVAIACLDGALARAGGDPRAFDDAAAEALRERLRARNTPATRGVVQARTLVEIADGRSTLPLESVTKLQLRRLGFCGIRSQIEVAGPHGSRFWLDIAIDEARTFYECDGEGKYMDAAMRGGRSLDRVLLDEKQREDWVRGVTGWRFIRGGAAHATPDALEARLRSFGLRIPAPRKLLLLPRQPLARGV